MFTRIKNSRFKSVKKLPEIVRFAPMAILLMGSIYVFAQGLSIVFKTN